MKTLTLTIAEPWFSMIRDGKKKEEYREIKDHYFHQLYNYWYARSCHEGDERLWSIDGSAVKYIGCIKRTNFDWLKVWSEVESKCLKKAEEY